MTTLLQDQQPASASRCQMTDVACECHAALDAVPFWESQGFQELDCASPDVKSALSCVLDLGVIDFRASCRLEF